MLIPELDKYAMSRDHALDPDRVEDILAHLDHFAYASREHVILARCSTSGVVSAVCARSTLTTTIPMSGLSCFATRQGPGRR